MLDFTSAGYLGLSHGTDLLSPWSALTTGVPVALYEPPLLRQLQNQVALLVDARRALLGNSTLHLFWDLFGQLGSRDMTIFIDNGAYPISRSAAERAQSLGSRLVNLPHFNAELARRIVSQNRPRNLVILADGLCSGCGRLAPLADYLDIAGEWNGIVVADDTQAIGILGESPSDSDPFGIGGGGNCARFAGTADNLLNVSSLAKGFGVPIATLAGDGDFVREFERHSETRIHCSPPSQAHVAATAHALHINRVKGNTLRRHLACLIQHMRDGMSRLGLRLIGGLFPVQTLAFSSRSLASRTHAALQEAGVRTVLRRLRCVGRIGISFVINANHSLSDVQHAITAMAHAVAGRSAYIQEVEHAYSI